MKSFLQFIIEAKSFSVQKEKQNIELSTEEIREEYLKGNIFNEGDVIEKTNTGEFGTITRRGTNYLICVTEEGKMFRAWITDVKEVE